MTSRPALALGACTLLFVFMACGGEGDAAAERALAGVDSTDDASPDTESEPTLDQSPAAYALTTDDLEDATDGVTAFTADSQRTFDLDAKNYGKVVATQGGEAMLTSWGYLGGYETVFVPEGRDAAVLEGAYYAVLELHLFSTPAGASMAYHHFVQKLNTTQAKPIEIGEVGNEATAWRMLSGKFTNSDKTRVHSSVLFRRGNLVTVILVIGEDKHVDAGTMEELATIVDNKALGRGRSSQAAPAATQGPR